MKKNKVVISYSGGLDSSTLLYKLLSENYSVTAINFNYGSKHNQVERLHAKQICSDLSVPYIEINLPFVGQLFKSNLLMSGGEVPCGDYDKETMSQTVVPGRNGIFLSILAGYAESVGAHKVAIANHSGDHYLYPDCRPEWVEAINKTITIASEGKVEIISPFSHLSKGDICTLAQKLNVPIKKTWSCYQNFDIHCGQCGTCRERKKAFLEAQLNDPTQYLQ